MTFEDLLGREELRVRSRRDIVSLYDEVRRAALAGELELAGHSLPTTLNAWIEKVEGPDKRLKRDRDVVNFSLADGPALERFIERLADSRGGNRPARTVYLSRASYELFGSLRALVGAYEESLGSGAGRKDEILGALSDLQAAVALFLQSYDGTREALRLPDRSLPQERVKVRKKRAKRERR